jgi:LysR family transcriptional regulator, positive regulator for ilvC
MDLRDLRLFLHLSKSLHFARSSRELHISASGLTRAIQRLEEELGVPLFERDNRTVRLTAAGQRCRDYAVTALEQWTELKSGLQAQGSELQGTLSLFCSVTASYSFLHELVQRFRDFHPQVELQLHTGDSALALQRVVDEMEDMAIAALPARLPKMLEFLPLGESPLVCIGPAEDCPLKKLIQMTDRLNEPDWQTMPVIMPESGLARARLEHWFTQRKLSPKIYAQVSGHEAMVSMVSLGCGVAVVPRVVVDNSPMRDRIQILPFMQELEPFSIGLCTIRRKFANPLVKAFWSVAQQRGL